MQLHRTRREECPSCITLVYCSSYYKSCRVDIQLRTTVHGTSYSLGQQVPPQPIATLRVLAPVLPAWLKNISRSEERIVPEQSSNHVQVRQPLISDLLVDLIRQVGQLSQNGRAQLILGKQTWSTILLEHWHPLKQGHQGLEDIRQLGRGSEVGEEASGGGDGEGVHGPGHSGRVIMNVREAIHSAVGQGDSRRRHGVEVM